MIVALGLGSSLGNRRRYVELALRRLDAAADLRLLRCSRLYRTPPMAGGTARGWFLNAVALFDAQCSAQAFLRRCVELEARAGRRRVRHWGDRTLDLDVLIAGDAISDDPGLTIPHPAIARRGFVLTPLVEVWPTGEHPGTGRRWADLPSPPGPRPVPVGVLAAMRPSLYLDVHTRPPAAGEGERQPWKSSSTPQISITSARSTTGASSPASPPTHR